MTGFGQSKQTATLPSQQPSAFQVVLLIIEHEYTTSNIISKLNTTKSCRSIDAQYLICVIVLYCSTKADFIVDTKYVSMPEYKWVFVCTCVIVLKLKMENIIPQYFKPRNQKKSSTFSCKSLQSHKLLLKELALLSILLLNNIAQDKSDVIETANLSYQS